MLSQDKGKKKAVVGRKKLEKMRARSTKEDRHYAELELSVGEEKENKVHQYNNGEGEQFGLAMERQPSKQFVEYLTLAVIV